MNRFDRIVALLIQLQARRVVRGATLAAQLGVSLRTVYRDLRTLEAAGVPIVGEAGVGYSLADGYRLPPVMFSREEVTALLTAEKLAAELTDAGSAARLRAAMDKLRAVLRPADREFVESLSPRIEVWGPNPRRWAARHSTSADPDAEPPPGPGPLDLHQRLLTAVGAEHVVRLRYHARYSDEVSERDVEPVGLYFSQRWHLVAFCRLRQDFRDFRFDRLLSLTVLPERFQPRPDALAEYQAQLRERRPAHVAVVRFSPAMAARVADDKHYFGWTHEAPAPDGMQRAHRVITQSARRAGDLGYLARWLLSMAGDVTIVSPPALAEEVRHLARAAVAAFDGAMSDAA